jgi:hypothetical protein
MHRPTHRVALVGVTAPEPGDLNARSPAEIAEGVAAGTLSPTAGQWVAVDEAVNVAGTFYWRGVAIGAATGGALAWFLLRRR